MKHSQIYNKIKKTILLSAEEKQSALADILKMETDEDYRRKVSFDDGEDRIPAALFIFSQTDLGLNFWGIVNNKLRAEIIDANLKAELEDA